MKIYVAGAWVEQKERARPMIAELLKMGHTITHDWTVAEVHPGKFDSDLSDEDRHRHAADDISGVLRCDLLWLLSANTNGASGSWVELGIALGRPKTSRPLIIVSGSMNRRTIFTSHADHLYGTDAEALKAIGQIPARLRSSLCGCGYFHGTGERCGPF